MIDFHINYSDSKSWYDNTQMLSLDLIEKNMKDNGFEGALLIGLPGISSINGFVEARKNSSSFFRFAPFLDCSRIDDSLQEILDNDFNFIKFHPRFSNFSILDMPEKVFKILNEKKKTLIVCGWQQSLNLPISDLNPLNIDRLAKKYKDMSFVITHMGGQSVWDAFFCARSNKNIYLDTSYFTHFFSGTSLMNDFNVILDKLDQKVIFGSDYPECNIDEELNTIQNLNLSSSKLDNILFKNAMELFSKYE